MCSKALCLAAVLVLCATQTPTGALAFEQGSGAAMGSHFGHGHFGHHFHRHRVLIVPYADYYDEGDGYGDTAVISYPPPAPSAPAPEVAPCHRNIETFTVPSADGGTREIKIISCP